MQPHSLNIGTQLCAVFPFINRADLDFKAHKNIRTAVSFAAISLCCRLLKINCQKLTAAMGLNDYEYRRDDIYIYANTEHCSFASAYRMV